MSAESLPQFGDFKPWDHYDPLVQEAGASYEELKAANKALLEKFSEMSGSEALVFYCMYVVPSQMDLNGALINEISSSSMDFAHITDFINMLKYEFNLAKPTEAVPNPAEKTADFISQINELITAIRSDGLIDDSNKDELIQPLEGLKNTLVGKTMTKIWQEADDKINPDGGPLKKMLNEFDVMSTVTGTVSQSTEAKIKYEVNEFNSLMNFDKESIKAQTKLSDQFVNRMKQ